MCIYISIFVGLYQSRHQKSDAEKMAELEKYYSANVHDERLQEKFVQLNRDEGTDEFIQWCVFFGKKSIQYLFFEINLICSGH